MKKRKYLWITGLLLLCVAALAGCKKQEEQEKQQDIPLLLPVETVIETETVLRRDLYELTTKDAEYSPHIENLSFVENGAIETMKCKLGSSVKKGDVLAIQSEETFVKEAQRRQGIYDQQKESYEQALAAINQKLANTSDRDTKEWLTLQKTQLQEEYELYEPILAEGVLEAELRLGHNEIVAPFDGDICGCHAEGEYMAAGQVVLAIADSSRGYVVISSYMSKKEFEKYDSVTAYVDGKETKLEYAEDMQTETDTYTCFLLPEGTEISFGEFVLIVFVDNMHEQVLSIPLEAVYMDKNGNYVYKMEDGKRKKQAIKTGYKNGTYVEILEGLQEGDVVYVKK